MPECQKFDLQRDYAAGVYLSEAPSRPRFLFGVKKAILQVLIVVRNKMLNSCRILHKAGSKLPTWLIVFIVCKIIQTPVKKTFIFGILIVN